MLQDGAIETALKDGYPVAWGAPTYKMLMEDWRALENILAPVITDPSKAEMRLGLLGGGSIEFWSLDKPDSIRGRKYKRFIVNEAAFVPNLVDIFNYIIRPTLIDFEGEADFAGTPKGMNGFWVLYNIVDAEWTRWQMSSYSNPHVPHKELDGAKKTMPQDVFEQEIMAQFLEDGAGMFRGVRASATAEVQERGIEGHQYVIGGDWGRFNDATVFIVIDLTLKSVVYMLRLLDTDYSTQRLRLKALSDRFNHALILAEQNSIGQPQIEELQKMDVPIQGFITTNATKAEIIQALQLGFEMEDIKIIPDEILINELLAFAGERLPSGLIRYGAPEGMHDDCVIALCLAWWAGVASQTWDMI